MSTHHRALSVLARPECVDDDVLLYVLRAVIVRGLPVSLVDTIVLEHAIDQADAKSYAALAKIFKDATARDHLVLLPVFEASHWSLLAYRPAWHQWYSCDSIRDAHGVAYHRRRHIRVLAALAERRIVSEEGARVYLYDDMPQQPAGYECARYVLFYALALLSVLCAPETRDRQERSTEALEAALRKVSERNRLAFEERLIAELLKINK